MYIDVDNRTISSATISSAGNNFFQVKTGYTANVGSLALASSLTSASIKIGTATEANKPGYLGTLVLNMGSSPVKYGFEVNCGVLKLIGTGQSLSAPFTVNGSGEIHMIDKDGNYTTYNNGGVITVNAGKFYAGRVVAPSISITNGGLLSSSNAIRLISNGTTNTIDGQLIVNGYDNAGNQYTGDDGLTYYTRYFSLRFGNGTNQSTDYDAAQITNIGVNGSIVQTASNAKAVNDILGQVNVSSATSSLKFQSNIVIAGRGKLTLNSTNAFATIDASKKVIATQAGTTFYISRKYYDSSATNYYSDSDLVVNTNNDLGALAFGSNTKLTLTIADDAVFSLGKIITQSGSNGTFTFVLDNWHDYSFKIVDMTLEDLEKISFYEEVVEGAGTKLSKLDVKFVETDLGSGDYWVNSVPEPSAYAMIFGAIALGFVAYRRAKVRGRA